MYCIAAEQEAESSEIGKFWVEAGFIEMGLYVKLKEESRILVCDCLKSLTTVRTIMKDQDGSWPNLAGSFFDSSVVCLWEKRGTFSSSHILCKLSF